MVKVVGLLHTLKENPNVLKLLKGMLAGNIGEVRPTRDLASELGCAYPELESLLGVTTEEVTALLEFLANESILERCSEDKLVLCPYCGSLNLRPSLRCPKCGSANIARGRLLEHFSCGNVGLEDEYLAAGKYMCSKCGKELRFLGRDYRSLGVNHKCHNCWEVFSEATLKWQCVTCSLLFADVEAKETVLHSYRINEEKRPALESELGAWLEFELGPKAAFVEFLKNRGYDVTDGARINGGSKSGAGHVLDILAQRDDGFITYTIGIGVLIDGQGREIGLEDVFAFDDKAYDLGIHDKVLLVVPKLSREAGQFAQRQNIRVLEDRDLEALLALPALSVPRRVSKGPFRFETKAKLLGLLRKLDYKVKEKAKVWGRSGAEHALDILAYNDDGIINHTLGIGVVLAEDEVGLDAVSSLDSMAYDVGIHDKVLLVSPRLSQKARQFAQYQGIKVIEVDDPAKLT